MTNPQSEVKCCEKCVGTVVNHSMERMDEYCENRDCPCHKESPVSQSVCLHRGTANYEQGFGWRCNDCGEWSGNHGGSPGGSGKLPVSQSVEGWEKEFDERFTEIGTDPAFPTRKIFKLYVLTDDVKTFFSTTLTTLVKEMEGKKKEGTHNQHDCDSLFCIKDREFDAGISAAVEVVKKMGV